MSAPSLSPNAAHVHVFSLDVPAGERNELAALLCPEETARFNRFLREIDRHRYTVARGKLRSVLANYVTQPPEQIAFAHGVNGKPLLADATNDLHFNLSHSAGWCAIALARVPLGIDLEVLRDDVQAEAVAGSYFTAEEQASLWAVPVSERPRQFFHCWTRKEAFLKGIGSGLTIRATSASVGSPGPGQPLRIHAPELGPEPAEWTVCDLDCGPQLLAALAVRGPVENVQIYA